MRSILSTVLLAATFLVVAQEFSTDLIPEDLKENAHAIIRKDNDVFTILSIDKAKSTTDYAVTILNEKGKRLGNFVAFYDKLSSIDGIEITVYDKHGDRIRKIKSSDIVDVSAVSGGTLFDDSRVKWVEIEEPNYPYTVEYKYTKNYKFLYFIPNKSFYPAQHVAVESSTQVLEYPPSVGARYKEQLFEGEKRDYDSNGNRILKWEVKQLKALELEPYGPSFSEVTPSIKLFPSKFSFDGYVGDMSTWDGMAAWQNKLNEGRDELPQGTIAKVRELTAGMSQLDKIKTIYEYVQKNTRYVSVQLGVGGFQPFPAKVVDEVGYGDCKALTFYTKSLLKAIDIPSNYTLVYGGDSPPKLDKEFPESAFNHAILCVPNNRDTVWLECTSQVNPFGFQGNFTGNREVLVVNESGGKIVRTTYYPPEGNVKRSNLEVKVDESGNALVKRTTDYTGLMADDFHGLVTQGPEKQKDWIQRSMQLSTFEVNDFSLTKGTAEAIHFTANLTVNKLLSKSGTRMFLQPNVMNKNSFVPQKLKERKHDVLIEVGYIEHDTVYFDFPPAFRVEAVFSPIEITSEFGEYKAEVQSDENGLRYIRYFRQNDGRFKQDTYQAFLDFHKEVVNADKRKIALISGT
jgi:transglutaminase-like putative cysteine protease